MREQPSREKWYENAFDVFAVVVGAVLFCAAIIWAFNRWQEERALAQLSAVIQESTVQMQKQLNAVMPTPTRAAVEVWNPPKSVEECSARTGGLINEEWKKCRSGYKSFQ